MPPLPLTPRRLLSEARSGAKKRGIPFTLTLTDILLLLERSEGRCEITGIRFSDEPGRGSVRPWRMSIDRIDSDEGYYPENCRLVCVAVNNAMRDWGEIILWTIALALVQKLEDANVEIEGPPGRPGEVGREAGQSLA